MYSRKTTPKVRDGKVQKKNNQEPTPNYYRGNLAEFVIDRERPGEGHRHVLLQKDVRAFLGILPEWEELSRGLNAIVLATAESDAMGWHRPGVVAVCAWPRDIWDTWGIGFYEEHEDILARIGVPCESKEGSVICKFTEDSARAFQLLHILTHELGHHHDRMTTRTQVRASRGERFAEEYARKYEAVIFSSYAHLFPLH